MNAYEMTEEESIDFYIQNLDVGELEEELKNYMIMYRELEKENKELKYTLDCVLEDYYDCE